MSEAIGDRAASHAGNRDELVRQIRRELLGPAPAGPEIDGDGPVPSTDPDERGPFRQAGSGEEIITRERPAQRYGAGVLHPVRTPGDDEAGGDGTASGEPEDEAAPAFADAARSGDEDAEPSANLQAFEDDRDDFDLSGANSLRPSSMGISFLAELESSGALPVGVSGGRYERRGGAPGQHWWFRRPVRADVRCPHAALIADGQYRARLDGGGPLRLEVLVRARPYEGGLHLITVSLVNRSAPGDGNAALDERCLFQSAFAVRARTADGDGAVHPYPESSGGRGDREAASIALLYRRQRTFAVGHGCAADWDEPDAAAERVAVVRAECLPVFEAPSITPDVLLEDGRKLEVSMAALAGLTPGDDGFAAVEAVAGGYEAWIARRREEAASLPERFRAAASDHLGQCEEAARRMRDGMAYLRGDALAREAFALANRAMLLQQVRSRLGWRAAEFDSDEVRVTYPEPYVRADEAALTEQGQPWRAFQIAFLLLSVRSVDDGAPGDRDTVELIWFPTGGGKTEAYLGLAAFHMFLRRLRDPRHDGVDVLMRYTLRLLTAQQFQRAATLLAAMEYLRRKQPERLGGHPFAIGLWVGSGSTPNRREDAVRALGELQRRRNRRNPFILLRCPWCQAQMGPFEARGRGRGRRRVRGAPAVLGYEQSGGTVVLGCPDSACDFAGGLPIHVIDEDIYERRPSFVVATVDKLATLAWYPQARSIFGIGANGDRDRRPPGLVVQDELHLISGPLGSMAGLYEAVIDELCTDRREEPPARPKIVSSTATISRYREQILALYGRPDVALFPPPGLAAGDSFFGRYATDEDGAALPGRRYVGVHAVGYGSLQAAQVRVFASALQAPQPFSPEHRDPWWTLVVFFNSLRELGAAVSLVQSDVADHLRVIRERTGAPYGSMRRLRRVEELTSRLQDDEVPAMLESLGIAASDRGRGGPVDVCLASSILEVGVDIERLSLMAVVGQPKTTSQYIQVTGRVGRSWRERPGLILSLYSPVRPRDRSHFERFRSYHQRLYAEVEPASVTPYSPPAFERALHAVMAIYARQAGDETAANAPHPYPAALIDRLHGILAARVEVSASGDPEAREAFEEAFGRRAREWRQWERTRWGSPGRSPADADVPLLRVAGAYASRETASLSWPTPLSMRNVDAGCEGTITTLYATAQETG